MSGSLAGFFHAFLTVGSIAIMSTKEPIYTLTDALLVSFHKTTPIIPNMNHPISM